jgi:hypothetical protein
VRVLFKALHCAVWSQGWRFIVIYFSEFSMAGFRWLARGKTAVQFSKKHRKAIAC